MTDDHPQLTIPLQQQSLHRLDNFDVGRNAELVGRLAQLAGGSGEPGLWLWGEPGSGRSHLLQATCHAAEQRGRRALFLPLTLLPRAPQVLEGLEAELMAVDDVEGWLGDRALEAALMALYQAQVQHHGALLFSASRSAQQLQFSLADLASRCRALPGFPVRPPDDAGLRRILGAAARRQGLTLSDGVLDFWLHRAPRSLPVLLEQLSALDGRALAEQRRVTIPLVKAVLAL